MLRIFSRKVIIAALLFSLLGLGSWHILAYTGSLVARATQSAIQSAIQSGGLTQPPKPAAPKTEKTAVTVSEGPAFVAGERLAYNVTWSRFVTAARLETEVVERGAFFGQEGFQLRAKVETTGDVKAIFFEMYNQYTTYASIKSLLPYRLENTIRQGVKQTDETVIFDQARREARFNNDSALPLPANTFDFISLLYALRQQPLADGWKQNFSVFYGKQLMEIEAEVKKRESVISQAGRYNAVRVNLTPKEKQFHKYRAQVWFSDDAQRLPVAIAAQLPFGEVRAELTNATQVTRTTQPRVQTAPLAEAPEGGIPPTNGHKPDGQRLEAKLPFDLGERINYEIAWGNFTSVGRASFEVRQKGYVGERRVFEFAAEATSIGAARTLINVNDQLISFADADSLEPIKTDTRLREGRRVKQVAADYDWSSKQAKLPNGTVIAIAPGTLDLLTLFYSIRAAELKPGMLSQYAFLDANHRLRGVAVRVNKTEPIGSALGTRDALQLDILTPDKTQLIAQAWISNDARRLPLYIATRTRFGELRFQIATVANPQ
jgi:hypothetical protein